MSGALAGDRPLTFLTPAHLHAAAALPDGVVIAEPCGCGGSWTTYRAIGFDEMPAWAVLAVTHQEAVLWAPQVTHAVPKTIREIVTQRATAL